MSLLAILFALAAMPAAAQDATSAAIPGPPGVIATTTLKGGSVRTAAVDPNGRMICQTMETLGTRLGGHKVCKTRAEWREEAAENRRAVDRVQLGRSSGEKGY